MKLKWRMVPAAMALCFLLQGSVVYAENTKNLDTPVAIPDFIFEEGESIFTPLKGTVKEIITREDGAKFIRVENEEQEVDFRVQAQTFFTNHEGVIPMEEINVGDSVVMYYIMPQFSISIYPPQFDGLVCFQDMHEGIGSIVVGVFDENNLSDKKDLILHIDNDTDIRDQEGNPYNGDIAGKPVVAYTSIMTLSLPAQTTPSKIVVLDIPLAEELIPMDKFEIGEENASQIPIFVNGAHVEGAKAYLNEDGILMFPLRDIVNMAGYELQWDEESQSIRIGVGITVKIGEDSYTIGRAVPQSLGAAPTLVDGITYVPVDFLTTFLNFELQIHEGIFSFVTDEVQEIEE